MMKIFLILAGFGHLLCAIADCLLSYSKDGKITINDRHPEKMAIQFKNFNPTNVIFGIILGIFGIALFDMGYLVLANWMKQYSYSICIIMLCVSAILFPFLSAIHVICGGIEWFYIKMNKTNEANTMIWDFFNKTFIIMIVGYSCLLVYFAFLFFMIVLGKTCLPRWTCVFNAAIFLIALFPFKCIPAKGNISGSIMFFCLAFLF